jgi:hypothetical protein
MRKILIILLLLSAIAAQAQLPHGKQAFQSTALPLRSIGLKADRLLTVPWLSALPALPITYNGDSTRGSIMGLTTDSCLYQWTGSTWLRYLTASRAAALYQPIGSYLTSYTETDPIFNASAAAGITGTNITNWNTAFGWGNHASSGYAPLASPTFTGTVSGITKAMVGLSNVENTALSTWTGSGNITTIGTITSGTWQGTAIGDTYISSAATWNAKQNALTNPVTGTGASGQIAYWDGTSTQTATSTFTFDGVRFGVGVSTPASSAVADFSSTDKGLLPPRMTTSQRNAIASPAQSLLVFDTDLNMLMVYRNSTWDYVGDNYTLWKNTTPILVTNSNVATNYLDITIPANLLNNAGRNSLRIRASGYIINTSGASNGVSYSISHGGTNRWLAANTLVSNAALRPWNIDLTLKHLGSDLVALSGQFNLSPTNGAGTGFGAIVAPATQATLGATNYTLSQSSAQTFRLAVQWTTAASPLCTFTMNAATVTVE